MDERSKKELDEHRSLTMEVEYMDRIYFLRSDTFVVTADWVKMMNRLCALNTDDHLLSTLEPLPEIPLSVVQARQRVGTLCPEVADAFRRMMEMKKAAASRKSGKNGHEGHSSRVPVSQEGGYAPNYHLDSPPYRGNSRGDQDSDHTGNKSHGSDKITITKEPSDLSTSSADWRGESSFGNLTRETSTSSITSGNTTSSVKLTPPHAPFAQPPNRRSPINAEPSFNSDDFRTKMSLVEEEPSTSSLTSMKIEAPMPVRASSLSEAANPPATSVILSTNRAPNTRESATLRPQTRASDAVNAAAPSLDTGSRRNVPVDAHANTATDTTTATQKAATRTAMAEGKADETNPSAATATVTRGAATAYAVTEDPFQSLSKSAVRSRPVSALPARARNNETIVDCSDSDDDTDASSMRWRSAHGTSNRDANSTDVSTSQLDLSFSDLQTDAQNTSSFSISSLVAQNNKLQGHNTKSNDTSQLTDIFASGTTALSVSALMQSQIEASLLQNQAAKQNVVSSTHRDMTASRSVGSTIAKQPAVSTSGTSTPQKKNPNLSFSAILESLPGGASYAQGANTPSLADFSDSEDESLESSLDMYRQLQQQGRSRIASADSKHSQLSVAAVPAVSKPLPPSNPTSTFNAFSTNQVDTRSMTTPVVSESTTVPAVHTTTPSLAVASHDASGIPPRPSTARGRTEPAPFTRPMSAARYHADQASTQASKGEETKPSQPRFIKSEWDSDSEEEMPAVLGTAMNTTALNGSQKKEHKDTYDYDIDVSFDKTLSFSNTMNKSSDSCVPHINDVHGAYPKYKGTLSTSSPRETKWDDWDDDTDDATPAHRNESQVLFLESKSPEPHFKKEMPHYSTTSGISSRRSSLGATNASAAVGNENLFSSPNVHQDQKNFYQYPETPEAKRDYYSEMAKQRSRQSHQTAPNIHSDPTIRPDEDFASANWDEE